VNLLFLDSIEKDVYGGMEEWIRLVASGLAARGHRVRVVGRPQSRFLDRLGREAEHVPLQPLDISGDFHPVTIAALKRILRENQTDVIIVNFNKDVRLGGLAARLEGDVRVIWSVGLDITRDSWLHKILTPRLVDGVIVPSESLKKQITRHEYISPDMVQVVSIGIPDTSARMSPSAHEKLREKYGWPADSIVAITVGRLVEQKGHRYLVEAMPELVRAAPQLRFLWCGNGPLEAQLREQSERLGVARHILFAGMLSSVEEELAGADLMIHPSVEEPFGIAVLEGMRAGLPIVASHVGGIPEVLGDTGLLVEPRDAMAIIRAVKHLLSKLENRAELGNMARVRFEERFSVGAMLGTIESYLAEIIRTEKRHG
jgi:glycosyltransferase involved in cell wall biosynthesis